MDCFSGVSFLDKIVCCESSLLPAVLSMACLSLWCRFAIFFVCCVLLQSLPLPLPPPLPFLLPFPLPLPLPLPLPFGPPLL